MYMGTVNNRTMWCMLCTWVQSTIVLCGVCYVHGQSTIALCGVCYVHGQSTIALCNMHMGTVNNSLCGVCYAHCEGLAWLIKSQENL